MSNFKAINFVKQKENNTNCESNGNQLNGNEIKEFYQNVITSSDPLNEAIKTHLNTTIDKRVNKCPKVVNKTENLNKSIKLESIFKMCQNGETEECLQWIAMGFDVNLRDQYFWTPLMCSSCAGHQHIVLVLLENNAEIWAKDRNGRTATDLALINGHKHICALIKKYEKYGKSIEKTNNNLDKNKCNEEIDGNVAKSCCVCGYQYIGCDIRHKCSIVHQIQGKTNQKFNYFYKISENNKGFQMMLRNGWTRDRGLGPNGSGMKAPIRTVLKRDRLGLGNSVGHKPKVTHFNSFDEKSVHNPIKENKSSKEIQRIRKEIKLKRLEINFRQQFK